MNYPADNETLDCPNCKGRSCSFAHPQPHRIGWDYRLRGSDPHLPRIIDVAFCRSCGEPVIFYRRTAVSASNTRVERDGLIYPPSSSRSPAPPEVHDEDSVLASDYGEAIACEPHSLQAAAMLLGLCASSILVAKCEADPSRTLGGQLKQASDDNKLPRFIDDQSGGLLDHRNRSAHPWFDDEGERLAVEQDDVDWCFEIVGLFFDHFYVEPARLAKRQARVDALKQERE